MTAGDWKKWLAIGTGVGIEIRGEDLEVMLVRVRPYGVSVLGAVTLARFRQRPAAEWGAEYSAFLRRHGATHLAAVVLLPRQDLIVRFVSLPGVANKDLDAAVRFQLDGLHPWAEEEAVHAWARTRNAPGVLIGIARAETIERYAALLAEAGIRVAAFTFSAAALHAAARVLAAPPAGGFLAALETPAGLEVYGESEARPVFSALFDLPEERARALALAELRLGEESRQLRPEQLLPPPQSLPEGVELAPRALLYATAITAATPWLGLGGNLLPAELRASSSRAVYIPTAVLAALLLVAVTALGVYGRIEDRRYVAALRAETARWTQQAAQVRELETRIEQLRARRQQLYEFRLRTRQDMDALLELTRILEPPTWLSSLHLNRSTALLSGETTRAPELLEILDKSPLFRNSQFTTSMAKAAGGENFAIRAEREAQILERRP
jgi:Tfp pilus assembly protein PilN